MRLGDWVRPPRHLLVLFVAVTAVSAAALGWASWELVRQDRDLARQRAQERRESAAALAVGALQRTLDSLDAQLITLASVPPADLAGRASDYARTLPDEAVLLVVRADEVAAYPAGRLLYYPVVPRVPASAFAAAHVVDVAEFQQNDHAKAVSLLRPMATSGPPAVRAEALLRIARNLRKAGRRQQAIETYMELARLGDVRISDTNGAPAELVARAAICDLLAEQNDASRLTSEARALRTDLESGRWRVLRPVYDFYSASAERWLGTPAGPDKTLSAPSPAQVLSETAREIWSDRRASALGSGRSARRVADTSVLVVERPLRDGTIALAGRPSFVASSAELGSVPDASDTRVTLADADGRLVMGAAVPDKDYTVRLGSATGLPWTVYATSAGDPPVGLFTPRSQVVLAGLSAVVLLITGGSYLIGRAVVRELRVARLQSDFVSAVSHEFRTPLTAMRQMSELLVQGRVGSDDVRQQYYEVLQHESGRLQRLVEGLLKFGRMEADALPFQFAPIEPHVFVRDVVNEFGREAARQGYDILVDGHAIAARVNVDREALGCVLWNLLDNAMKYLSPECRTIWASLEHNDGRVAIRVRDRGVGIPDADRSRIFDKFVRGDAAQSLGVPGTGIGLAVSRQIVLRHGGDITVESTPGEGAIFTIVLPAEEAAGHATDAEIGTPQVSRST